MTRPRLCRRRTWRSCRWPGTPHHRQTRLDRSAGRPIQRPHRHRSPSCSTTVRCRCGLIRRLLDTNVHVANPHRWARRNRSGHPVGASSYCRRRPYGSKDQIHHQHVALRQSLEQAVIGVGWTGVAVAWVDSPVSTASPQILCSRSDSRHHRYCCHRRTAQPHLLHMTITTNGQGAVASCSRRCSTSVLPSSQSSTPARKSHRHKLACTSSDQTRTFVTVLDALIAVFDIQMDQFVPAGCQYTILNMCI